eukprot:scaffold30656_cov62-Cyclotella_meneghiniana.AAC.9
MEDTTTAPPAEDEGVITMNNDDEQQQKKNDYAMDIIPRKNNEDVYSAFRLNDDCTTRQHTDNNNKSGQWHRIPSLLLVRGDHIALKVGDTSPAKCTSLPQETGKGKDKNNNSSPIIVQAGERLSMETLGTDAKLLSRTGNKSTVTLKSEEDLLTLANGVQVFELLETPLESFLSKDTFDIMHLRLAIYLLFIHTNLKSIEKATTNPSSGSSCSLRIMLGSLPDIPIHNCDIIDPSIRGAVKLLLIMYMDNTHTDSLMLPTGNNAHVSILLGMHRHGKNLINNGGDDDEQNLGETATSKPTRWLLTRYIAATLQSRLKSSADIVSSSLLTIPPASMHLLEKLGLVTAIALIDDELACEPHSTPQQLLIPSKDGGLKILDLCPIFEDEYSTDDDEEPTNQLSSRSSSRRNNIEMASIDSDDDENEETKFAHSFSAPARRVSRKATKRIKKQFKR